MASSVDKQRFQFLPFSFIIAYLRVIEVFLCCGSYRTFILILVLSGVHAIFKEQPGRESRVYYFSLLSVTVQR